ncbi:MAG: Thiol:disulfide interchange protein DsbD [Chlamydiae bacterium]|nr:Thiol:disulfide interchange protein DsbD [Chlamydiota bacterium]
MLKRMTLSILLLMSLGSYSWAQAPFHIDREDSSPDPVQAEIIVEQESIQPNHPFWVGIHLKLADDWHAYWKNPGDSGMAPLVQWNLPDDFEVGPLQWPTPKKYILNSAVGFGYENEVVLLAEVTPPVTAKDPVELSANIKWVVCDNSSCLPGGATVTKTIPITSATPKPEASSQSYFTNTRKNLPRPLSEAQAEKKEGLITLQFETTTVFGGAQFYPEDLDKIDYTVDPVLAKSSERPNTYHLILKEAEDSNPDAPLKGVLALLANENSGDVLEAYEIDVAVTGKGSQTVAINLEGESATSSVDAYTTGNHDFQGGIALALVLAFAGGLILNLMPCVLPVISFKILSFIKMAGKSRSLILKHGVAFSIGVLLSFWALAGVLLTLQAYGQAVGWGFQLQEPLFVAILAAIIFVFALSLFSVFEIGTGLASMAGQAQTSGASEGVAASFFSGILATAVATPCTGPFLGTAVGFAVTLPTLQAMLIFTSLGLGMASPYLLLGAFPGLLRFMPKPGNWMITFKEIMGFIMLATVLWLIWVFGAQTDALAVFFLLAGFFFLAIGCWIFGKWGTPIKKKMVRSFSYAFTLSFFVVGSLILYKAASTSSFYMDDQNLIAMATPGERSARSGWEPFSLERIAELREQGVPIFIDFTAKWCLICQTNHLVLGAQEVTNKFEELGVVRMKADWTKSNPIITEELRKFGRNSVPLYLLYGSDPKAAPEMLPQVLTPEVVLEYLEKVN